MVKPGALIGNKGKILAMNTPDDYVLLLDNICIKRVGDKQVKRKLGRRNF